jgi:hypothetical protein
MAIPGQGFAAAALTDPLDAVKKAFAGVGELLKNTVLPPLEHTLKMFKDIGEVFRTALPILDVVGAKLRAVGEAFKTAFRENIGERVTAVFQGIRKAIDFALPTYLVDYFKDVGGKISTAFGSILKSLGSLAGAAVVAGTALAAVGRAMGSFVSKANPAVWDQFTLALNDLMAVVGRALVPILSNVVIPVVRSFADMLMQLSPIGNALGQALKPLVQVFGAVFEVVGRVLGKVGEMAQAAAPAFAALGQVLVSVVQAVQPIFDVLVDVIGGAFVEAMKLVAEAVKTVAPFLLAFGRIMGDVAQFVASGVRTLLALVGINLPDTPGTKPGSSVGAATRQAGHASVEEVVKQAQRSAFSLGTASSDPMAKVADSTKAIQQRADEIYRFIVEIPGKIGEYILGLPQAMWNLFKGFADDLHKAVLELPRLIGDTIRELPRLIGDTIRLAPKLATAVATTAGRGVRAAADAIPGAGLVVRAYDFGRRQLDKPGVFGFTSLNPF